MTAIVDGFITIRGDGPAVGGITAARLKSLPRVAREKLKVLERIERKRAGEYGAIVDSQDKLHVKRRELEASINHAETEIARRWVRYSSEDMRQVAEWRTELVEIRAEIATLDDEKRKLLSGISPETIRRWLKNEPPGRRFCENRGDASLRKGQGPLEALDECRAKLASLKAQSSTARDAPLTLDVAEQRVIEEIELLAKAGAPHFSSVFVVHHTHTGRRGFPNTIKWPRTYVPDKNTWAPDGFGLAVWANVDFIKARALTELRENFRPAEAMTLEQRDALIAECTKAILALEYREEALVTACETARIQVTRRHDATPMAVLQLEIDPRPVPLALAA